MKTESCNYNKSKVPPCDLMQRLDEYKSINHTSFTADCVIFDHRGQRI